MTPAHGSNSIDTVLIGVTYACQCDCVHCGVASSRDTKRRELTNQELEGLLNQCAELKARSVGFFGGEPLLRKNILDLIALAHSKGLITNIDTNGARLTPAFVRRLKEAGLDIIGVSIDASQAEEHDRLRGVKGLHATAVKGIQLCVDQSISCYVSTYASHENLASGDLLRVVELARSLRADWVRVCAPFATGRWIACTEKRLEPAERSAVERVAAADPEFIRLEDHGTCPAMRQTLMYVSPYGDVQPCCYIPVTLGSVRKESLAEIVARARQHGMYKRFGDLESCPMNCDAFRREYIKPQPRKA